jgi:hypothetical protein
LRGKSRCFLNVVLANARTHYPREWFDPREWFGEDWKLLGYFNHHG